MNRRSTNPYARFRDTEMILRDELAVDRTLLANERTLLSYLRSGVALVIAGVTMIHFSQVGWFMAVGVLCIPMGFMVAAFGAIRFFRVQRLLASIRASTPARRRSPPGPRAED